jgi:mono/diheme cytochrome c family protein
MCGQNAGLQPLSARRHLESAEDESMKKFLALAFLLSSILIVGAAAVSRSSPVLVTKVNTARTAAAIFAKDCASCHGKDGRAKTFKAKFNHARNLTDAQWQDSVSDERLFNSLNNGKGKMPAFGKKLSEEEINSLVNYVRGLKR